jgi:tRNA threonylcarbamoyladenosine biosynthesis protein TsaE
MNTFTASSLAEINSVANELIIHFAGKKVIAFYGEMGVGKTTLIKALCKAMGVTDVVSSPTYSLVNEYVTSTGSTVFHFDFYRINSIEEVYDMGFEEYFDSGNYCFVEWPEKVAELLPNKVLKIALSLAAHDVRSIHIS